MIYIDSDGVLCDFYAWCRTYDPTITAKTHEQIWRVMAEHADTCFLQSPLMPDAASLLQMLKSPGVFVLTALTPPELLAPYTAEPEKAVEQHRKNKIDFYTALGVDKEKIIIVSDSLEKDNYAVGGNVLIDDYPKNIERWTRAGGIGILINPAETPKEINKLNGIICL